MYDLFLWKCFKWKLRIEGIFLTQNIDLNYALLNKILYSVLFLLHWWKRLKSNIMYLFLDHFYKWANKGATYSPAGASINWWSCWSAVPVTTLPRNTLTSMNRWYFWADLLSNDESDVNPSILDIVIRIFGSTIRNIFNAMPGRNPWITDLTTFLHKDFKPQF